MDNELKMFRELFESKNEVIVRSLGRPSPKNRDFSKDYIAIWVNDSKKYHKAYNWDLGFEANLSDEDIEKDTTSVSKKEAEAFIKYIENEEDIKLKLLKDTTKIVPFSN